MSRDKEMCAICLVRLGLSPYELLLCIKVVSIQTFILQNAICVFISCNEPCPIGDVVENKKSLFKRWIEKRFSKKGLRKSGHEGKEKINRVLCYESQE